MSEFARRRKSWVRNAFPALDQTPSQLRRAEKRARCFSNASGFPYLTKDGSIVALSDGAFPPIDSETVTSSLHLR